MFCHIPRTGGTDVVTSITHTREHHWHRVTDPHHWAPMSDDYHRFTVVRNPYTRWLSLMNFCRQQVVKLASLSMDQPGVSLARRRLRQLDQWGYRGWSQQILDQRQHDHYRRIMEITPAEAWTWLLSPPQHELVEWDMAWYPSESREWQRDFDLVMPGEWDSNTVPKHYDISLLTRLPDITLSVAAYYSGDFERFGYDATQIPQKK